MKLLVPKNKAGKTDVVTRFMQILFGVVILGFLIIVVAGNLRVSTGFDTGSTEANLTDQALLNVSSGVSSFFSNTGTWFNILSVVIIIALVIVVWRKSRGAGSTSGGGGDDTL